MITEIQLLNYRGFLNHKVPFRGATIVVGKNNAGKSTIVEALKLVAIVITRSPNLRYIPPPDWLDAPAAVLGVGPDISGMDIEFNNLCHQYQDPPAQIKASFDDGLTVNIYLHSEHEGIFAVLREKNGNPITTQTKARVHAWRHINVLPPVGRLNITERVLQDDYVRKNLNTNLSHQHFRNQLHYLGNSESEASNLDSHDFTDPEEISQFLMFSKLADATWPQLQVRSLDIDPASANPRQIKLWVRDGRYVSEVGWVGSGLQAWLQTCWFMARCPKNSIVVLDEPDVFLHADLQRKLYRLLAGHFSQVIIATHSTEILAEVNPDAVLIVDKEEPSSKFAENIPAVQNVMNNIGGAHNLQLARLWAAKKCLFVEGDDLEFLNRFHELVFPESMISLGALPVISIGGYGNWKLAVGATIGLKNAGDKAIQAYCILDPDYRIEEDHLPVLKAANEVKLRLHIWRKKEIENYIVNAACISRYIRSKSGKSVPKENIVETRIDQICEEQKNYIFDQLADHNLNKDRKGGLAKANEKTRKIIEGKWQTLNGKIEICSGKHIMSELSKWSQNNYGVSFGTLSIAREMKFEELDAEIIKVISAIENNEPFN